MSRGYIHLYTGDGKGKTTAAVGLCARAAGAGLHCAFFQFLKGESSSERASLEKLGVFVKSPALPPLFSWQADEEAKRRLCEENRALLAAARAAAPQYDLLVLDEALVCAALGYFSQGELLDFFNSKPQRLELAATGRGAGEALLAAADYVTEMRALKHPFEKGLAARKGIEF